LLADSIGIFQINRMGRYPAEIEKRIPGIDLLYFGISCPPPMQSIN